MTTNNYGDILLALGNYRFSMNTAAYQNLRRTNEYRWSKQDMVGREPALQFVGPGEQSIELSGVIYPYFAGGLGQLDAMRAEAAEGEPLPFHDGLGNYWADWVITRVEETQTHFFHNGTPRKIEFKLSLKKYGA